MIKDTLLKLIDGKHLTQQEATASTEEIMRAEATPSQIASFLTALKMNGETVDEIAGMAMAMRSLMLKVETGIPEIFDTCGTGGDGKGTFNISTVTAFVAAAAGLTVAKHGNRASSSKCGSADILEALGVKIDAPTNSMVRALKQIGIAFFFAPLYHPAMKNAAPIRKEIGFRTVLVQRKMDKSKSITSCGLVN